MRWEKKAESEREWWTLTNVCDLCINRSEYEEMLMRDLFLQFSYTLLSVFISIMMKYDEILNVLRSLLLLLLAHSLWWELKQHFENLLLTEKFHQRPINQKLNLISWHATFIVAAAGCWLLAHTVVVTSSQRNHFKNHKNKEKISSTDKFSLRSVETEWFT